MAAGASFGEFHVSQFGETVLQDSKLFHLNSWVYFVIPDFFFHY